MEKNSQKAPKKTSDPSKIKSPMKLCYPDKIRIDCHIISFLPSSGWLASAELCERIQAYKILIIDYLINLLQDATDISWAYAKASHAVLLSIFGSGYTQGLACCSTL